MSLSPTTRRNFLSAGLALMGAAAVPSLAEAHARRHVPKRREHSHQHPVERVRIQDHACVAVNASTGEIIEGDCAHDERIPASLTKLITTYVVFKAIKEGRLKLDDCATVSYRAGHRRGDGEVMLGAPVGSDVDVRTLLLALNLKSACDAARILAEKVAGSEDAFVELMNEEAQKLGMMKTRFADSSGASPESRTTAYDMALSLSALHRDFSENQYGDILTAKHFEFNGQIIGRHDAVMYEDNAGERDGRILISKTGFIGEAGRNQAVLASDGSEFVSVVVMGERTQNARHSEVLQLIETALKKAACTSKDIIGLILSPGSCPVSAHLATATPALTL